MMKKRFFQIGKYFIIVIMIGLIYAGICTYTGFGIPCVFHSITGLKCPGCGLTHMFLALLHLDFKTAYLENQFLFLLLPLFGLAACFHAVQYIRSGTVKRFRGENALAYFLIGMLILWGIFRNLPL